MCTSKLWLSIGAVMGGLAVFAGAFGAHGLDENVLEPNFGTMEPKVVAGQTIPARAKYLRDFETAAKYHMYHALALMVVGLVSLRGYNPALAVAGTSFLLGILLFSGSLYVLVLTGMTWLGAITPIGGIALLVGWGALAIGAAPPRGKGDCIVRTEEANESATGARRIHEPSTAT